MIASVREHYEAHPDPSPETYPIGPGQLERLDDNFHFGWSWHRYRYAYRPWDGLRILDAGCGTGLSTLALARLNPGSRVVGVDISPHSLDLARERARASGGLLGEFLEHDLNEPLPASIGPFDFIACRGVLGQSDDPSRILKNLVDRLDPRGLLLATFPSTVGHQAARQMRRAIGAVAEPGMSLVERAEIGVELFRALRPEHPIRWYEGQSQGGAVPGVERVIAGYLNESERDWKLEEAIDEVERAGLQFLFAPQRQPWMADRVFLQAEVPARLKALVDGCSERSRTILIDALDPGLYLEGYKVYACLAGSEPRLPGWPDEVQRDPLAIERLIPHATGLVAPAEVGPDPAVSRGKVSWRVANGAIGEIDWRADTLMRAVDSKRTVGELEELLRGMTGVIESPEVRRERWLVLANIGFVILESPDPRQHLDCRHLGPIRDRLDCPCPRRWVRACDRHGLCTIDLVGPTDEQHGALQHALTLLGADQVVACARCSDYQPEVWTG
jgi:SAM-dependent methyltransferase